MNVYLTSEAADTLESVGEAMVVLGLAWGVSRAYPSLRSPMLVAGVGVGLVVAARRYSEPPRFTGRLAAPVEEETIEEELDVIDVTPSRSS